MQPKQRQQRKCCNWRAYWCTRSCRKLSAFEAEKPLSQGIETNEHSNYSKTKFEGLCFEDLMHI